MTPVIGRRVASALALLLSLVALVLAFRGVEWGALCGALRQARWMLVLVACGVATLSCMVRAWRWRVALSAEKSVRYGDVFWATMVGYLSNNVLPARAGDILRAAVLGRKAELSGSFALATTVVERAVDAVALVCVGLGAAAVVGWLPDWFFGAAQVVGVVALVGGMGAMVAPCYEASLRRGVLRLPLRPAWRGRLEGMVSGCLLGARALWHPARGVSFLILTAAVWLADAAAAVLVARSLGLDLGMARALLLLAALGLASTVPSTPGGLGIYQFVTVTVLEPLGLPRAGALAFGLVSQAAYYATVALWGVVGTRQLARRGP